MLLWLPKVPFHLTERNTELSSLNLPFDCYFSPPFPEILENCKLFHQRRHTRTLQVKSPTKRKGLGLGLGRDLLLR